MCRTNNWRLPVYLISALTGKISHWNCSKFFLGEFLAFGFLKSRNKLMNSKKSLKYSH